MRYHLVVLLLLAAAVLIAHGRSLNDGLFFDDHWHIRQYAHGGWALGDLLEATTIEPDRFMDAWWQQRTIRWWYARPLSTLAAKVVLEFGDGSVRGLHAFSIGLQLINAWMVSLLCLRLTRKRVWGVMGGLLFALHAHSVITVAWLAAQNCLLQLAFTLAALLTYIRASGLDPYPCLESPRAPATGPDDHARLPSAPPPLSSGWFAAAVVLWILALLSREAAIVLPAILFAFDAAYGGRRHLQRRWPAYVLMGAIGLGYVGWRFFLHQEPMPDFYVRRYDGPAWIAWYAVKLMHSLVGVLWLSPMMFGPTLRYDPIREVPGDCLLMVGMLVVLAGWYVLTCRRIRGWWIWPVWLLLTLLPVAPVMATPHAAYMPSVAFAVGLVLGAGRRGQVRPTLLRPLAVVVPLVFLVLTCVHVMVYRWQWDSVLAGERFTLARVGSGPRPREARHLFFINLPFVNIYARDQLAELWSREGIGAGAPARAPASREEPDFRCHALTYANNVLLMDQRSVVEQIDAHALALSIEGRPYFSGALGRFLIESMRPDGLPRQGEVISRELFDVEIVEADADGVRRMVFRFRRPLSSPKFAFYVVTGRFGAMPLTFRDHPTMRAIEPLASAPAPTGAEVQEASRQLAEGHARAGRTLLRAILASDDEELRDEANARFREVAACVAEARAAPVQGLFDRDLLTTEQWLRIADWWTSAVDDGDVQRAWVGRDAFASLRELRDLLFVDLGMAASVIRTDLYLTGPAYPGPQPPR